MLIITFYYSNHMENTQSDLKILKISRIKDIIDAMSGNDPDWRPNGQARRGRVAGGEPAEVPNVEALEAEVVDHVVWLRGRLERQESGGLEED